MLQYCAIVLGDFRGNEHAGMMGNVLECERSAQSLAFRTVLCPILVQWAQQVSPGACNSLSIVVPFRKKYFVHWTTGLVNDFSLLRNISDGGVFAWSMGFEKDLLNLPLLWKRDGKVVLFGLVHCSVLGFLIQLMESLFITDALYCDFLLAISGLCIE